MENNLKWTLETSHGSVITHYPESKNLEIHSHTLDFVVIYEKDPQATENAQFWDVDLGVHLDHDEIQMHGLLGQTWKNAQYKNSNLSEYLDGELSDYEVSSILDDTFTPMIIKLFNPIQ